MKHFLLAISLALGFSTSVLAADAEKPETVRVCVDIQGKDGKPVIDPKTKKPKQDCKEIKKHKKYEGTKVPEKK
jgi:hypothetical protein